MSFFNTRGRQRPISKGLLHFSVWYIYSLNLVVLLFWTDCVCLVAGVIQHSPTGISLWMGGHDSLTEGGWEWMDASPFRYLRWAAGICENVLKDI